MCVAIGRYFCDIICTQHEHHNNGGSHVDGVPAALQMAFDRLRDHSVVISLNVRFQKWRFWFLRKRRSLDSLSDTTATNYGSLASYKKNLALYSL